MPKIRLVVMVVRKLLDQETLLSTEPGSETPVQKRRLTATKKQFHLE